MMDSRMTEILQGMQELSLEQLQAMLQHAVNLKMEEGAKEKPVEDDDIDYEAIKKNRDKEKEEIEKIVVKLKKLDAKKYYEATDSGIAQLFSDLFPMHRYNVTIKKFLFFDGQRWVPDDEGLKAGHDLKALCDALQQYAERIGRDNYKKDIKKMSNSRGRQALLRDVKDNTEICNESLDEEDYKINAQNGVLDLSGDEPVLLPHSPRGLMSKICQAAYDPDADGSEWEKFIDTVMMGNKEKIKYLQKIAGMMLTGDTTEEKMFILYGPSTRNGKSTFCEALRYMLGDYGIAVRPETLAQKNNVDSRQASGDIARMAGVRYCCVSEPRKRMVFDVALIKNLTGGDGITARHLNSREFTFRPKMTMVVNTNHLPIIPDMTLFSSNRVQVLTFDKHFREEEQDVELKNRLREPENLSGILNWCVRGWFLYKTEGLNPPEPVIAATQEYRNDSDKYGMFIGECLTRVDGAWMPGKQVYKLYTDWCAENGFGTENMANFFAEMKEHGIVRRQTYYVKTLGKTLRNVIVGWAVSTDAPGNGWEQYQGDTPFGPFHSDKPAPAPTAAPAPAVGSKVVAYKQEELPIA